MTRTFQSTLILVLLLVSGVRPGVAQIDPAARYRTMETSHFRVTYGPGLERLAARVVAAAERTRTYLADRFPSVPGGTVDILLTDNVDFSNGFATVFPSNRVVIYARPPIDDQALAYHADWLELVVSHELTHIYHLDRAGAVGRLMRLVFGRLPLLFPMFPAVATPAWSTEGLAVEVESALTGFGRVHGSHHRMIVRTAVLSGTFERMDRLNEFSPIWPGDLRTYVYGSLFMDWLGERYGEDVHGRLLEKTSSAGLPPFLFFDEVARRTFGVTFDTAYAEWRRELEATYAQLADSLTALGLTESERLTTHPRLAQHPRISADGRYLAYVAEDGTNVPATRVIDLATMERVAAHRRNGLSAPSWTPDGDLVISQFEFDGPYSIRFDLWRHGERSGRLTRGARVQDPHVSPGGHTAVAVQNGEGGAALALVDLETGVVRPLTQLDPDVHWSFPRWSPDGGRIAAVRWRRGGDTEIVVLDSAGVEQTVLIREPALALSPAWSPDGQWVLFSSDRTGITNLYAVRVAPGWAPRLRQVTNVLTGVFQPEVSPDGQWLYFSRYYADGYAIERMPFDPRSWRDPLPVPARVIVANGGEDGGAPTAEQIPESRPYSPWRSLLPKAWQPMYFGRSRVGTYVGAGISGEDLVGRHAFTARAAADIEGSGRWQGAFAYSYAGFGQPVLSVEVGRFWDDLGLLALPDSSVTERFEREDRIGVFATLNRRRWRNAASLSLGYERKSYQRELGNGRFRLADAQDVMNALVVRAGFSNARSPLYAISREDGFGLSVLYERALESDRTVYRDSSGVFARDYHEVRAAGSIFKSISLGAFAHHVFALHGTLYKSDGPGAALRGVGGHSGGSATFLGFSLTGGARLLPVRGFEPDALIGTRAWTATAEWRIPIALLGRRPPFSPLFIDRLAAAAFLDAGDAWCTARQSNGSLTCRRTAAADTPILGAGAELMADIGFAGIFAARLRGGVGVPVRGPGNGARFYFALGSNF